MSEPTYKLCPRCGEPIETALLDGHVPGCDGSIPARPVGANPPPWGLNREALDIDESEPIGDVKEYLDRELPDHESVYDRAEALADQHLRYDGSERGRR